MKPEKLERVNSTFDILPTVVNLIGLDYDPRIYVGSDYFDPDSKLVIFPNGSWITDNGSYYASDDTHDDTLGQEEIDARNLEVQNLFTISRMIYDSDYFHYRPTIPFPKER
jgi:lipoteichoic acid synthase